MKKTILLLAFCYATTCMFATNYGLYVKGVQVTSDNCGDILGDGTVSYDEISNTLTLNNANISCDGQNAITISESQPFTIKCIGTNTISVTNDGYAVSANKTTTFTGPGSISMSSHLVTYAGFSGGLTIQDDCSVTLQSEVAACLVTGIITVDNAKLVAKGNGTVMTIACSGLTMENGVQIRSNHTFDAEQKKFLNAAGEEAKDEIVIKKRSLIDYNRICIDNISIENNSGEKVPVEGMDFGNIHAGNTYRFPFYLSIKNNADGDLPQGSQIQIDCTVNDIHLGNLWAILKKSLGKDSLLLLSVPVSMSSNSLNHGENSITFQVPKIIDENNIEHTCTSDACIAHFYVNVQTALETVNMSPKGESVKFLHNGQLLIKYNGKIYNALGGEVK